MATRKSNQNQSNFSVFGTRPTDSIYLPDIPYSVRLNCKDGGLFIGGFEAQHRKTTPTKRLILISLKSPNFTEVSEKLKILLGFKYFLSLLLTLMALYSHLIRFAVATSKNNRLINCLIKSKRLCQKKTQG